MQRISVTINPDCTIEYEVQGVKGKSCKDVTKFIDALSSKTITTRKTREFFLEPPNKNMLRGG